MNGVGTITPIDRSHVELIVARRDREVAHTARRRDLQHEVGGERDAEGLEHDLRSHVDAEFVIVASGEDDELMASARAERFEALANFGQRRPRRVDELREVRGRVGLEEVARHDHQRRVVDVAEQAEEFAHGATRGVGGGREREIAHYVDEVTVGDWNRTSFSPSHGV